MPRTSVVVIGAGQAGLAVSHLLNEHAVDHVVLDKGRTASRWDDHSWQSLRLLTPNWLTRLPGWRYRGQDPAGFMAATEVADYLRAYAIASGAPVREGVQVLSVRRAAGGYRIVTSAGTWTSAAVVVATGWCDEPAVPSMAQRLDERIAQLTPRDYSRPDDLPDGGVLVVGASASGVQLADELAGAGRRVALAVGRHTRLTRTYRGMDICWWLDAMGTFARPADDMPDLAAARHEPSLQLAGRPDRRDVDLATLQDRGVGLLGRVCHVSGCRIQLRDDLAATTAAAEARLESLLGRIDTFANTTGLAGELADTPQRAPVKISGHLESLDLLRAGIRSVIWATGYRRSYGWLNVPVLDQGGEIRHVRGRTPAPGLHVVGMRWQSRRDSSFIDGVGHDARIVTSQILAHLGSGRLCRSAA